MELVRKIEVAKFHAPQPVEFTYTKHTLDELPQYVFPFSANLLRQAYTEYCVRAAMNAAMYSNGTCSRELKTKFDIWRWKLHRFLIKCRVII